MKNYPNKLYWIDYTAAGPMIGPWPFEIVGFETKITTWEPKSDTYISNHLNNIFTEIENWNPDIVIIWFFGITDLNTPTDEPSKLIDLCKRIRNSPNLENTKLIAFFRMKEASLEKKLEWNNLYNFHSLLPLRIIEHSKIAKQLSGRQPDDTEGATHYLSTHGSWEIFENFRHEQKQSDVLLKANGKFVSAPRIRLLGINTNKHQWIKDGIKPNTPTKISYLTKDLSKWQYGLSEKEIQDLNDLNNSSSSDYQLLLGVNSDFLDIEEPEMIRSIKKANDNGWQIFIIEHMWLENHWLTHYDNLLYEKDSIEKRTSDVMQIICP